MLAVGVLVSCAAAAAAQTPQPFPRPGEQPARAPLPPRTPGTAGETPAEPVATPDARTAQTPPAATPAAAAVPGAPTEAELGVPLYPTAQYLVSYDAGLGQRYYLFGTATAYADIVQYYRNILRSRGNEVFESPRVHVFEMGRFREQTMAFPPSVTVKDHAEGPGGGYLHVPAQGAATRYPTIIQVVPVPPAERR